MVKVDPKPVAIASVVKKVDPAVAVAAAAAAAKKKSDDEKAAKKIADQKGINK